ncbi:MAG TPA: hypothetical protein VHR45_23200 [Thermoanaerobaculia bacterium]|nr:hypothetical protein [Thermoanaerobaculia bacterium]
MNHARLRLSVALVGLVLAAVAQTAAAAGAPGERVSAEQAAWLEFDHGLQSFAAGDDREARAQWRHLQHFYAGLAQTFGTPVRELLTDLDRRLARPRSTTLPADFDRWPGDRRVAWLIDQLDEVAAAQQGSPGGVPLGEDWRVRRLIAEGEPAVPALIDAVEHDGRFTRSYHYWRDFIHSRTVLTVREAALVAVSSILHHSVFEPVSTGDDFTSGGAAAGAAAASRLRAYFAKWGGVEFTDRMMRQLTEPATTPEAARNAASNLARLGAADVRGTTVWTGGRGAADDDAKRAAIAKYQHPTIAEAMVAAMDREEASLAAGGAQLRKYLRQQAIEQWTRSLADLGDARIAPELAARATCEADRSAQLCFVRACLRLGDAGPRDAFAADVAEGKVPLLSHDNWGRGDLDLALWLLSEHPTAPAVRARARIADPDHPWSGPLREALAKLPIGTSTGMHRDPWLTMKLLRPLLDDTTPAHVAYDIHDRLVQGTAWSMSGGIPALLGDPSQRREHADARVCDEAAIRLSLWVAGLPAFHPLLADAGSRLAALRNEVDRRLRQAPVAPDAAPATATTRS